MTTRPCRTAGEGVTVGAMGAGLAGRSTTGRLVSAFLAALLVAAWVVPGTARAADARVEEAQARRAERQARLDEIYQRLAELESEAEQLEAQLATLTQQQAVEQEQAAQAAGSLGLRVREAYMQGDTDPGLALLASGSAEEAADRARMLGLLASRSRGDFEDADAARVRTEAATAAVVATQATLEARRAELQAAEAEGRALVAQAEAEERSASQAALAQAGRSGRYVGPGGGPGRVVGDVGCPVGGNPSYRDTWGAPRSGGRSHKGTDIFEDRGVSIHAYENGVVTRKNNSSVGGTSLYMTGDSGNVYYYTHLAGYVEGVDEGTRVTAGQHIAFNGDTGNARGLPHLHFEVRPGGGGSVNPYPYVARACG